MKNECEPYLGITNDYDDEGICDVEIAPYPAKGCLGRF